MGTSTDILGCKDELSSIPRTPIHRKLLLNLEEAASYTGVGVNRLRELSHDADFEREVVCVVGRRRMFVRARLEEFFSGNPGVLA
jgi:hypothetical protein